MRHVTAAVEAEAPAAASTADLVAEVADAARRLESASPADIIGWAVERFAGDVVVASSFEDAVLIHVAVSADPTIEILLLDTQYLFAETLWYVDELRSRFDLNLTVARPQVQPDNRWQIDTAECCNLRKVEPLNRSLAGHAAWVTGLKRVDAPSRSNAGVVEWDAARSMVKLNPLATWTADDMAAYAERHHLPPNPLTERGYPSIGCWPCTRPVAPGEDPRSGRWAGSSKTECGLHVAGASS